MNKFKDKNIFKWITVAIFLVLIGPNFAHANSVCPAMIKILSGSIEIDGEIVNKPSIPLGNQGSKDYSLQVYKPKNGKGELLKIKFTHPNSRFSLLQRAVLAYPIFFAQFDFYATENELVISNSTRLNQLTTNGFKIANGNQKYEDYEFTEQRSENGLTLMATQRDFFDHDWLGDHMIGALVMSKYFQDRITNYAKFEQALSNNNEAATTRALKDPSANRGSIAVASYWDVITALIGNDVVAWSDPSQDKVAVEERLVTLLLTYDDAISTGLHSQLTKRILEAGGGTFPKNLEKVITDFDVTNPSQPKTEQEIRQMVKEMLSNLH